MKKITIILSSIIFIVITITFLTPIQSAIHNASYTEETVVVPDEDILDISISPYFLTSNNNIYLWGNLAPNGELVPTNYTTYFNEYLNDNEYIIKSNEISGPRGFLTNNNRLFLWGINTNGQVGDGTTTTVDNPLDVTSFYALNEGETIIDFNVYNATHVLTSENRIFTHGSFIYTGNGATENILSPTDISSFYTLNSGENIIELGTYYFLTDQNRVFSWGDNSYGQVGNNTTTAVTTITDITPFFTTVLNAGENIVKFYPSTSNKAFLTDQNRIFFWGRNNNGQIGNNTEINVLVPTDISSFYTLNSEENIIDFYGSKSPKFLTDQNRIFSWGYNYSNQVGNNDDTDVSTPVDISSFYTLNSGENIIKINSSDDSTLFLTDQNRIFSWGRNTYGQLGNNTIIDIPVPTDISSFYTLNSGENIIDIDTEWVSRFLTDQNRLFSWGGGSNRYVGFDAGAYVLTPTDITSYFSDPLELGYTEIIEVERNSTITRLLTVLPLIIVGAVVVLTVTIGFKKEN